eukprot:m.342267 g.342267  ORF g.342267 m.342267 type:complete len:220 (-) comp21166_c0_seq1:104-763(-)
MSAVQISFRGKVIALSLLAIIGLLVFRESVMNSLKKEPTIDEVNANQEAVANPVPRLPGSARNFYTLHALDTHGRNFPFSKLKGKVVLIVNVASQDTKAKLHYHALQSLYDKYKDQGFEILAFPCNQFGNMEPGSDSEIAQYTRETFQVTFQMMKKIDVNGGSMSEVYKILKSVSPGMIRWNFHGKFLINKRGDIVKAARTPQYATALEKDIQALLNEQ